MSRLEIVNADFGARDMRRDRKNGYIVTLRIEQSIDEVEVAWSATAGADRKLSSEMRLGASGERGALFVANVNPLDGFQTPQSVRESV
jgi:hypothetical protein